MDRLSKPQKLVYDMEKYADGNIAVICGSMLIEGSGDQAELTAAVNELYRLNTALRTRITETNQGAVQSVLEYMEQDIDTLYFNSKDELDRYAEDYAQKPLDLYGSLCEVKVVLLPERCGALIKLHHIIGDAWSLALMGSQFIALINGEVPQVFSYTEHLENESAYLQSDHYIKDRTFFLEQFKKCDEVTYLSEKQSNSFVSARKAFAIGSEQRNRIIDYTKQNSISPFTLFMTAVATYISRTKLNAEKFYIGTAVLNRNGTREKNTVGMFVNTVPVLIELDNEKAFSENLNAVERSMVSILRHQKFNYGEVLSAIRQEHGFTEKLYDVMLSYQNAVIVGAKAESTWYHNGAQAEALQIHIDDRDSEGIFRIHFDYQTDKFTEHEIERMYGHVVNLLFAAIKDDSRPLYELAILSADERQKLMLDFNDTAVDYPRDKCVHQLFEEQVKKTPEKTAVIACDRTLTYGKLNEQANRIANSLIEQGVKPGDIVAFVLPRRSYLIAAMFGILKAGAAYLPMDPNYPRDRINYMVEDSKAAFLITEENITTLLAHKNDYNPNAKIASDNPCYCIYTSGSTGRPKGTVLTHRNVANFTANNKNNVVNKIIKSSYRSIVSVTTVGFDIFVTESILPLLNGLEIILADEKQASIQSELNTLLLRQKAGVLQTTPTKMRSLVGDAAECVYLKSLKAIILGGEAVDSSLVYTLKQLTSARIFNIYGPTETTVWSTNTEILSDTDITIGKPIANTQIYIVDRYMQPTPIGVPGELCIAGDGVGAGYLNRPELMAEKFIDNPFGLGKLYKTGDLAYWREDGNIVYVGRNDFQVKIRGLRIELGEIETAMGEFPGINMAVATDRRDENNRQYLVGYYTASDPVNEKDLRQHLAAKLPKYMVPNYFMRLERIPTTPSGKTDRKALPLPNFTVQTEEYVAPETETERKLGEIWSELLHINRVGKTDDFFDLGGDSLLAISALSKIKAAFQVELSVKDIMENSVLKQLASFIDKAGHAESKIRAVHKDKYVLLPQQKAIYAFIQKDPQSPAYNMPTRVRLPAGIDRERLKSCIKGVIDRHRSLKTRIVVEDSELYGIYDADANIVFEEYSTDDYSGFLRPFVLEEAPLVRIGFTEDSLLFDIHHIIADGESLNTILYDIMMLYNGVDTALSDIQFSDYSHYFYHVDFSEHKEYFKNMLRCDFEPVVLPQKRLENQAGGTSGVFHISQDLFEQVRRLARANSLTETMLFLGAYGILLSKYSAQKTILSSVVLSNRTHSETQGMVGMFVNTLPVCLSVDGETAEYFEKIKTLVLNLFRYQELPFLEIADAVGMNDKTVVNTAFVYQADGKKRLTVGGQDCEPEWIATGAAKFDLLFELTPSEAGCEVRIEYDRGKYDDLLIANLFAAYERILQQLEKKKISDISILSEEEYQKIVFDFNSTAVDYPRDVCIYLLFEEQVERTPDKIALIFEDKKFTYRQLNELSNGLAVSMRKCGIQAGDKVAVLLNRDERVILAQIATLKLGAVFIPVDSRYPRDRIEYILAESGAKIIIKNAENPLMFAQEKNIEDLDIVPVTAIEHTHINADDTCYIIFTSGSTGQPKGCTLTNRGLVNFCRNNNILEVCNKLDHQICVSVNTISFDYFIAESLLPLTNGYTIVLANEQESVDQELFINLVKEYGANIIQTTPTRYRLYFDAKCDLSYMRQFDVIVTSGEALPLDLLRVFHQNSNAQVFNPLGPSECSVWIAGGELHLNGHEVTSDDITIGRPIANTQLYILDQDYHPVPIGVAGELCVSGDGVGNGYLNRPDLTAERFMPNPFIQGKTMYHTGDLARWRANGEIEYLGRIDTQVKIRGLRIEIGEIESVMAGFAGIDAAAAADKRDADGRQYLVGYYTVKDTVDEKVLREYLASKLPKYMVPNYFVHVSQIPTTPSGKTDRKNLPTPDFSTGSYERKLVLPRNEREKTLCKIIGELLNEPQVSIQDDFFELGGDSLKAIEYVSKAHGVNIYFTLQNVFDYPTVEALCDYLRERPRTQFTYEEERLASYRPILQKNVWNPDFVPQRNKLGTVLLTGGTGFLGAHLIDALMKKDVDRVYCLVRGGSGIDAGQKLLQQLRYYFGQQYDDAFGKTIIPVSRDLEKEDVGDGLPANVNYVIHAAASVKHYGSWKYFKSANVEATRHIADYALKTGAKLIHISTISVSGNDMADQFDVYVSEEEKHFYESSLYIEQPLDNVYVRSKFEAEMVVLDTMRVGLQANIIRAGNLTNRKSDLKFQPNYKDNAFLKRVKAVLELGCLPDYLMPIYAEFSPVDTTAEAIAAIAEHMNDQYTVFHVNSNKGLYFDKILEYLDRAGYPMQILDGASFARLIRRTIDSRQAYIFEALSNDLSQDDQLQYDSNIRIENDFTVQYLKSIGFEWPDIDFAYIEGYLRYFMQLGYFGGANNDTE